MKNRKRNFCILSKYMLIVSGGMGILVFIMPLLLFGIVNVGNVIGILIGILFLFSGFFLLKIINGIKRIFEKKWKKILFSISVGFTSVIFVFFIIAQTLVCSKIGKKQIGADTVIVLGCQVIGTSPSLMLNERINACYMYLQENPNAKAILSGGQGADEGISEAECMYRTLVAKGILSNRLIMENQSTSTKENLIFSKKIMTELNLNPHVVIITNDFHCYRASAIANQLGIQSKTYSARTRWYLFPTYFMREICAVITQCILGK